MVRYPRADVSMSYFAMENPVVGGYTPEKVALRRAIALAVDVEEEIRLVRRGQAIPAQSPIGAGHVRLRPGVQERDERVQTARGRKALLDLYGYVDRDGDGWREQPDGTPLLIEYATQPDELSRQLDRRSGRRTWTRSACGSSSSIAKWPENLKASRAGKLMMWGVGWSARRPTATTFLVLGYGPSKGQANHARFDLPEFNRALRAAEAHCPTARSARP